MKNKYPVSRKNNIVVQDVDNETLMYDLNNNKAFCLNQTSAYIWQLCDGNRSLTEISQALSKKINAPVDEGLVWLGLEQLKKEKLIENEVIPPSGYEGMTRREAVRKVGLSSLIAIPVVMSLLAPTATLAASACSPKVGGACHCQEPACPGMNTVAAPSVVCPGAALVPEGQAGLVVCNSPNASCRCVGPFVCVNTGGSGQHKQGMCN